VAYRVIDGRDGRDLVLLTAGTISMESLLEDPVSIRLLGTLAGLGRVVLFDRRGIGLSDPPSDWDEHPLESTVDDLRAVAEAVGLKKLEIIANRLASAVAIVYADKYSEDVSKIVLFEPMSVELSIPMSQLQLSGEIDAATYWCPNRSKEPGFREWLNRAGQIGASPRMAERAYRQPDPAEIERFQGSVGRLTVPVLILRRPEHPMSTPVSEDTILAAIPTATRVDLPGSDVLIFGSDLDPLLSEVARFISGEELTFEPERKTVALLYSDLVESTHHASAMGDQNWRRQVERHDELIRSRVARRGGAVVKFTGDGALATLPSAEAALRVATELRAALNSDGLEVRVGVHVGDIEQLGDDISGIGVVVVSRVLNAARSGEILVTSTAVESALGSAHSFTPREKAQLKGVEGEWQLFSLDSLK
jgi:class 3 adenylate cyclase